MGRELPRGDIPTLILAVLAQAPAHGYAIARVIERDSANALRLREGSLYPALRALEQQGFISSGWVEPERGPARKVYTLTDAGRTDLARRAHDWHAYADAVAALLGKREVARG
ncbi:MAG: Transcriptional regulator, PadR family [uncultured Thermomicrobiales bacterium]|uniref:Transcriptional regulator, PadR family n=1 Tax=uncultured Thermomicrobiales bacterium TaxID=1645740 RepID=A0A6J4VAJ7_9BACT|nr:MAG: Transcriptional regulator, PadR family [uncultured Thermomicrobiales bacterium]